MGRNMDLNARVTGNVDDLTRAMKAGVKPVKDLDKAIKDAEKNAQGSAERSARAMIRAQNRELAERRRVYAASSKAQGAYYSEQAAKAKKNAALLAKVDAEEATRAAARVKTQDRMGTSLRNLGGEMRGALGPAAVGGAIAVAAGLAYATAKTIEFDKAMRNVNSLNHLNEGGFKALESQVLSISEVLPQSATTLAEGLYDIASSGYKGADGLTVLKASATAASAGLSTAETSAKAITAVLNAYGLKAGDAADVSDALFQTVNLGVVSFDELAGNIGDVVGAAATAKVSIGEVGAAIATMTLAGINGAEATTSLNQLFTKLIQPSEALQGVYRQLGYTSGEAALKQKGLKGVMEDIRKATGGSITAFLKLFPEIRAARGALALSLNDGKTYVKVWGQIAEKNSRAGATMSTLKEQMKAAGNQLQLARNQADRLAISIGVKVLPFLTRMVTVAREAGAGIVHGLGVVSHALGPTWDGLADTLNNVWHALGEIGHAVAPVAVGLGKLGAGAAIGGLNLLAGALGHVTGLMADHPAVVMAVAVAYGVHLAGGIARVATLMQVQLVMGLIHAITGMEKLGAAAAVARGALLALAATAAPVAALAAVFSAFMNWKQQADSAAEGTRHLDAAMKALGEGRSQDVVGEMRQAQAAVDAYDQMLRRVDDSNLFGKIVHWGDGWKILENEVTGDVDKLKEKTHELTTAMMADNTKAMEYLSASHGSIDDTSISRIVDAAHKAHIDLNQPLSAIKGQLDGLGLSGRKSAAELQKDLVTAMGDLDSNANNAEDAVKSLKDSLDGLIGVFLAADQANSDFEESLDSMTDALKRNASKVGTGVKAFSIYTPTGRENRAQVRGSVDKLLGQITSGAQAGKGGEELARMFATGTKELYAHAKAAGVDAKVMKQLLDEYHLTPAEVVSIIKQVGGKDATKAAAEFNRILGELDGKKAEAKIRGDVADLDAKIAQAKQKLKDPHLTKGAKAKIQGEISDLVAKKRAALKHLHDVERENTVAKLKGESSDLNSKISASKKKLSSLTSQNARVRVQAEIAQAQARLNQIQQEMAALNGTIATTYIKTFLGSTAGRVATGGLWTGRGVRRGYDTGGEVSGLLSGPGTGTSDSIPAPWLSNGEYVIRSRAVDHYGAGFFDRANAMKLAGGGRYASGGRVAEALEPMAAWSALVDRVAPPSASDVNSAWSERTSKLNEYRTALKELSKLEHARKKDLKEIRQAEGEVTKARNALAKATGTAAHAEQQFKKGISLSAFGGQVAAGNRASAAFLGNLQKIAARGHGELALALHELGGTAGADLARKAAAAPAKQLASLTGQVKAQASGKALSDNLDLGLRLLSALSGARKNLSIGDLIELLGTDEKTLVMLARAMGPTLHRIPRAKAFLAEAARVPGYASGGLVGGVGSGTSDSNLIRASRGEMVTSAIRTAQYSRELAQIQAGTLPQAQYITRTTQVMPGARIEIRETVDMDAAAQRVDFLSRVATFGDN